MCAFHQKVYLTAWNPQWETRFQAEAKRLAAAFEAEEYSATIRHVGSTSIRGMIAKPIVDILITINDTVRLQRGAEIMVKLGYTLFGECGRPGRLFLTKGDTEHDAFYAHLTGDRHPCALDMLDFQAIENRSEVVRSAYAHLKSELAARYTDDRTAYRAEKSYFIESVLDAYRIGEEIGHGSICTKTL